MRYRRRLVDMVMVALGLVGSGIAVHAQVPNVDSAPTTAPVVHTDHTITFSIRAPEAMKIDVVLRPGIPHAMTKGRDGLSTLTVGPLDVVDGVNAIDFANPRVMSGRSRHFSVIEIPTLPPRFDQRQDVPHGAIEIREYSSQLVKLQRRLVVYLPPDYDAASDRARAR